MEQTKSKICTKIYVNIAFLKSNINSLHEEIENQIRFFKSVDSLLLNSIMYRKKSIKSIFVIISICLGIFLIMESIYIKIAVSIIAFVILSFMIKSIILQTRRIKNQVLLQNSRKLTLEFSQEPYWNHFKKSSFYKTNSIYNIYSNIGYVSVDNDFILFPHFACQISYTGLSIFVGKSLSSKMEHETHVISENQAYKYKYKKLEYQQWQYQRKDGGPDRRYSNNKLNNFYRYHLLHIENIFIEIESRKFYDDLRYLWNFDVDRKIIVIDNKKHGTEQRDQQETIKAVVSITYNWKDLNSIDSYLKSKNVLFNNYGETIEFEFKETTYIVDNKGTVKNCNKSVRDIVEAVYD